MIHASGLFTTSLRNPLPQLLLLYTHTHSTGRNADHVWDTQCGEGGVGNDAGRLAIVGTTDWPLSKKSGMRSYSYKGTSLRRNTPLVGPYSSPVPWDLW
jgi:hypothetical protein